MTETKWTKGPWVVVDHNWQETGIYGGDYRVAGLSLSVENEEDDASIEAEGLIVTANAHLIAAAPKMYEALAAEQAAKNAEWMHKIARFRAKVDNDDSVQEGIKQLAKKAVQLRDIADDLTARAMAKARGEA